MLYQARWNKAGSIYTCSTDTQDKENEGVRGPNGNARVRRFGGFHEEEAAGHGGGTLKK